MEYSDGDDISSDLLLNDSIKVTEYLYEKYKDRTFIIIGHRFNFIFIEC